MDYGIVVRGGGNINQDDKWIESYNRGEPNEIGLLPDWLYKLRSLLWLWIGGGRSKMGIDDLSPLAGLRKLETLNCSDTHVTSLSPFAAKILSELKVFCERYRFLAGVDVENAIFAKNCPLIIPPIECAVEGSDAVVEYFEQLGDNSRTLNETKVIFLGQGASGKTSLIKRLRNEPFDSKESQTHGIRIRKTRFDADGEDIQEISGDWIQLQTDKDEAWTEVAKSLEPLIESIKARKNRPEPKKYS